MSATQQPRPERANRQVLWTASEMLVLRNVYPERGRQGVHRLLPHRSPDAIANKARCCGIASPFRKRCGPKRNWEWTDHIDAAIRRAYESPGGSGAITKLSITIGRPIGTIYTRALRLGCTVPRSRGDSPWTAAEDTILRGSPHLVPGVLRSKLKRAGFERSGSSIVNRLRALKLDTKNPDHYTTGELATALGLHVTLIRRWVERGMLPAKRRSATDNDARIHRRDIRRFVIENVAAIDFRKVDKWWFTELLAGYDPE